MSAIIFCELTELIASDRTHPITDCAVASDSLPNCVSTFFNTRIDVTVPATSSVVVAFINAVFPRLLSLTMAQTAVAAHCCNAAFLGKRVMTPIMAVNNDPSITASVAWMRLYDNVLVVSM